MYPYYFVLDFHNVILHYKKKTLSKNLTEFCKEAGISIRTYNRLMAQPDSRVKDETILRICRELNIAPSEVLRFKE